VTAPGTSPDLTVVLLARDEAENLPSLLDRLITCLARTGIRYEVVVIDGGSVDGSREVAAQRGCRVVVQQKPGHGAALREALAEGRGRYLVLMDADHSHPPEVIPSLLARRDTADLVLASRYVPGGSSTDLPVRRWLSRFLNLVYRLLLRMPYKDVSSGFRLYRTEILGAMTLRAHHIDLQEEIVFRAHRAGYRIVEVPYEFAPRRRGTSHVRLASVTWHLVGTLVKLGRESMVAEGPRR
jgi:dolichol-phosphate mannosyltransferase